MGNNSNKQEPAYKILCPVCGSEVVELGAETSGATSYGCPICKIRFVIRGEPYEDKRHAN